MAEARVVRALVAAWQPNLCKMLEDNRWKRISKGSLLSSSVGLQLLLPQLWRKLRARRA